ncbi:MAG: ABC transporter substrate-binding protein [Actinobacteria bacterium]|nr:ABC transporter substrate-binding protein [Actinomycetota bacterium]
MLDNVRSHKIEDEEPAAFADKRVTRREFLKGAGIAGAAIGVGTTGLGSLLAACGGEETTTTAAVSTPTTGAATSTTAAASTTSVSAAAEIGRELKIGFASPQTGVLAFFGAPDKYCADRATEAIGDGLVCADGKKHPVTILTRDTQSDTNRAAQVAGDMINNDKVDLVTAASTSDVVVPVADQCEAAGMPCISTDIPWNNYIFGRGATPDKPFAWTYNVFAGMDDFYANYIDFWNQVPTNKKVAFLNSNDAMGQATDMSAKQFLPPAGFTPVSAPLYNVGTEDFSSSIALFKKEGCEIMHGSANPGDFANFWKQCLQQSFHPKTAAWFVALMFPEGAAALGDLVINQNADLIWHNAFPFKSPLVGDTCQQYADEYEKRTNSKWNVALCHGILFDWATDVLKRTANLDDKNSVLDAVKSTKMETISGMIDFTAAIDTSTTAHGPRRISENCYTTPLAIGQWRKGTGKWPYDQVIVGNVAAPMVTIQDKVQPLSYTS